jgi:UDP-GlcNAc:undecaprenyl-phosphate/decaprenyl-phosphate GlcNAc-1-phosphate transferase
MKLIIPCLASFLLTAIIMPYVIRLATACGCMDIPGERRHHKKATPRWGGIAFFSGVLPILLIENGNGSLTSYVIASIILVGMGMIDDLKSLGWKIKFSVMWAAAAIVIFGGNLTIDQIGSYGFLTSTDLGLFSIPFTFISIMGITNAINLLDGLNGLAGGVSLLGFLFMGIAALISGNIVVAVICFAFVGALAVFLLYNFPTARIFMGDTGSLFLGFSLSIMAVLLTQDKTLSIEALFPVLVLLIPIFDTLRVLAVRLLNGKNPFKADNLHLHYLLVQNNICPVKVTLFFWTLTALLGGIAISLISRPSMSYFNVLLTALTLLTMFAAYLTRKQQHIREYRPETLVRTTIKATMIRLNRRAVTIPGFAHKAGLMSLKWIVVLGVLFLDPQAFAETDYLVFRDPVYQAETLSPGKLVTGSNLPSQINEDNTLATLFPYLSSLENYHEK